jgi:dihydroxyacetone kinase-like protein
MTFDAIAIRGMFQTLAASVIGGAEELTRLDQAIGDADHGQNLERGFTAVLGRLDEISARPFDDALQELGSTLILNVGGASGPLYGKLFATIGRHLGDPERADKARLLAACEAGIGAVKQLGRSDVGQKTLLDVLVPSLEQLRADDATLPAVRERARAAAEATVPMLAQRGRAAYLGSRSRGHMDPGARSAELMVSAVCRYLEERR